MTEKQTVLRVLIAGSILNLLLVSAAMSFYIFLIRPAAAAFSNATRELTLLEEQETSLWTSAREVEQRNTDLDTLETAFLNLDDVVSFVALLETIAAESDVTISIDALAAGNPAITKRAEFRITTVGTLTNILRFIKRAELMPYFIQISSVNLATKGNQVQAVLHLEVLVL